MTQSFRSLISMTLVAAGVLVAGAGVHADTPKIVPKVVPKPAPVEAPKGAPKPAPEPAGPSCKLAEPEVPRGGRLDVTGERFGQAPVVRIAGKPARILERRENRISVQVAADSNGGAVTVQADGKTAECGTLVIIGKDR